MIGREKEAGIPGGRIIFPEEYLKGGVQGDKCKYSVMRHKGRSTKENAPRREGKEEQVEVAAWHARAAAQDCSSGLLGT